MSVSLTFTFLPFAMLFSHCCAETNANLQLVGCIVYLETLLFTALLAHLINPSTYNPNYPMLQLDPQANVPFCVFILQVTQSLCSV